MCVGNNKGTWAVGPKGLTASPKLANSLTKALKESWKDKRKPGAKGGNGLKITAGSNGGGKTGGGSSATMPSGPVAQD